MKKQIITFVVCLFSLGAMGQVNEHAIGLRLGGGNFVGTQISYQHGLSNLNRLEANLGFNSYSKGNGFHLSGAYQWVHQIEGDFNWYIGPAASLGSWSYDSGKDGSDDDGGYLGIGGQLGVEYNFDEIPLMVSLDTQPEIGLFNAYNSFNAGLAFCIRYRF